VKPQLPTTRESLIAAIAAGESFQYLFFWGHRKSTDFGVKKSCFSQWYESIFRLNDELYRTAEHYMMVRKARLFDDEDAAKAILAAATPNAAKSLGRRVRGFSEQRWLDHREEIVFTGNLAKFGQNSGLRKFILESAHAVLVEASPVDPIWGIGLAQEDSSAQIPSAWPGLNLLGFALMKVRAQLQAKV
jgi:ribA/ribD-fused uncharacterized protein